MQALRLKFSPIFNENISILVNMPQCSMCVDSLVPGIVSILIVFTHSTNTTLLYFVNQKVFLYDIIDKNWHTRAFIEISFKIYGEIVVQISIGHNGMNMCHGAMEFFQVSWLHMQSLRQQRRANTVGTLARRLVYRMPDSKGISFPLLHMFFFLQLCIIRNNNLPHQIVFGVAFLHPECVFLRAQLWKALLQSTENSGPRNTSKDIFLMFASCLQALCFLCNEIEVKISLLKDQSWKADLTPPSHAKPQNVERSLAYCSISPQNTQNDSNPVPPRRKEHHTEMLRGLQQTSSLL